MTTESSPSTATNQSLGFGGIGRIEVGMRVTTHPLWFKGQPRVESKRGVVERAHFVPGMSRVRIPGMDKLQTFWNFELEPVIT